ncbi:hypothetical protein DGG96_19055 [Legionella qingyii]|uniref:Uncharacterized protein n=1 Tax=Legionella qingyii TaxID=2184757 RepID=A0A317TYT6_9GAMM|nr:RCC1 domain-containing protein [Legionella qingyii]PWY54055.1 hypothetical protein DGG96_19055 [Legionella qingyii]RUR19152.1 hypothetical protein ELY20_16060 [Legionella qingyii]RUR22892.1 hypothetical protein ELY16_14110 [Legionella qingyii]
MALKEDGSVYVLGCNDEEQFGLDDTNKREKPNKI